MSEVKFEDIENANKQLIGTDIKGKTYIEVNQRIKAFKMIYPEGSIETEMISNGNGVCIFKAIAKNEEGKVLGTGTAYEKEGSSFINKTSYIENCETSSVGRALGMAGFGIDTSIASYEEVANAMQQKDGEKVINSKKVELFNMAIENNNVSKDVVDIILKQYGYEKIEEIKIKDYMKIIEDFKTKVNG